MPGRDQTGPQGQGPLTGRGLGFCGGAERPRLAAVGSRGVGSRGQGRRGAGRRGGRGGGGGGYGYRHQYWATGKTGSQRAAEAQQVEAPQEVPPVEASGEVEDQRASAMPLDDLAALRTQAAELARSLEALQQRLDQMEGQTK